MNIMYGSVRNVFQKLLQDGIKPFFLIPLGIGGKNVKCTVSHKGLWVIQGTLIDSVIIFDADSLRFCTVGQEKAHPAFPTAVVQNHIVFANQAAVCQAI